MTCLRFKPELWRADREPAAVTTGSGRSILQLLRAYCQHVAIARELAQADRGLRAGLADARTMVWSASRSLSRVVGSSNIGLWSCWPGRMRITHQSQLDRAVAGPKARPGPRPAPMGTLYAEEITRMATPIGQLSVDLLLQSTEFVRSINRASEQVNQLGRAVEQQNSMMARGFAGALGCSRDAQERAGDARRGFAVSAVTGFVKSSLDAATGNGRATANMSKRRHGIGGSLRTITTGARMHSFRSNGAGIGRGFGFPCPELRISKRSSPKTPPEKGAGVKKRLDDPKVRIFKRGVVREAAGRDRGERVRTRLNPPPAYAYAFRRARIWQGARTLDPAERRASRPRPWPPCRRDR